MYFHSCIRYWGTIKPLGVIVVKQNGAMPKSPFLRTFGYIFFFISNLVAQAPDLSLAENLSNLLSSREALNKQSTFCIFYPSQNNGLQKFTFPNVTKVVQFQIGKNKSNTVIQYNIINAKNLCLSYKFINSVMIRYIQFVSEKTFCGLRTSIMSRQNFLVTF